MAKRAVILTETELRDLRCVYCGSPLSTTMSPGMTLSCRAPDLEHAYAVVLPESGR